MPDLITELLVVKAPQLPTARCGALERCLTSWPTRPGDRGPTPTAGT